MGPHSGKGLAGDESFVFWILSVQGGHVSQQLDWFSVQPGADLLYHGLSFLTIFGVHPNLDQFMVTKGDVDLCENGFREPLLSGDDDRLEVVRTGPEMSFCRGFHSGDIFLEMTRFPV